MSTKPSATSAYIVPESRPPTKTSRKNQKSGIACPLVWDAEIGVDDVLVRPHLVRRAVADLLAVIEHDDAVGDVHHHAHVVLDQHDGRAVVVVDVEDEAAHVLLLFDVHPGHWLIEQQDGRFGGERTAELDALLQ